MYFFLKKIKFNLEERDKSKLFNMMALVEQFKGNDGWDESRMIIFFLKISSSELKRLERSMEPFIKLFFII